MSTNASADLNGRGNTYIVQTKEALLKIVLSSSWIGYELSVKRGVTGREIDVFLDTDNYPLGGKYQSTSMDIFNEILLCIEALLDGKIYVGKIGHKSALVLPQASQLYKIIYRGRFLSSEKIIHENELKKATSLRPLL